MSADPAQLRFFVDENTLGVGKALAIARRDVVHVGHPLLPDCPLGVLDIDWMPHIAARGLIVISRDRRIRTKPAELALLHAEGLRVFWIAGKRDLGTWGNLVRLVQRWDDIERTIDRLGAGPWFAAIHDRTITQLNVLPQPR